MSHSEEEKEFRDEEESSDDAPMSSLRNGGSEAESPSKRRRSQVNYAEEENGDEDEEEEFDGVNDDDGDDDEEDDDDDDDDVPLSSLASPSPKKKKAAAAAKASNGKTKKAAAPAKKKAKKKSSTPSVSVSSAKSASSSTDYKSASAALYGNANDKGLLIQRLLCRWWYAIQWPDASAIPDKPPQHYDALDGFPGVYLCTAGDEVGAIKDFRDKEKCPNFNNLAKKSSEELQTLLITALTEQRKQLIEAEGTGTETQKELDNLLKWANKVKPAAADKAAEKVLKAAKLSLN